MKRLGFSGFLVLVGGLFAACGGDTHPPPIPGDVVGTSGASGAGGHAGRGAGGQNELDSGAADSGERPSGSGGSAGDAGSTMNALAPVVSITSPTGADDPEVDPILKSATNSAHVVCHVEQSSARGAKPVDPGSVTIEMLDASMMSLTVPPQGAVQVQGQPNDYSSDFAYTAVPNGRVYFRCNAKDKSGVSASATLGTFVDHGPKIDLSSPKLKMGVPLQSLDVKFTVLPDPLLPSGDDLADVAKVNLSINGTDITDVTEDTNKPGHYSASVDLTSTQLFPTKLNGSTPLVITGTNKRGFTKTLTSTFIVDSTGPVVTLTGPKINTIVGGQSVLTFTVGDDGSGVKSVTVAVDQQAPATFTFDDAGVGVGMPAGAWTENHGTYTFLLGAFLKDATVQVLVNISARDGVGNSSDDSQSSASATYYVDTTPPLVDLDPPPLQERKGNVCSTQFDPLGAATSDLAVSKGFIMVRSICYDQGNFVDGILQPRYSGIDPNNLPKLFVQGDTAAGILKDTDGDTICDEIIDTSLPSRTLNPLGPTGNAYYPPDPSLAIPGVCGAGNDGSAPPQICPNNPGTDLTRIIQHEQGTMGAPDPVVYSLETDMCTISQLQLRQLPGVKNGWVCLAVRALDRTGNIGVSPPMRVCLNDQNPPSLGPVPKCATQSTMDDPPPSCASACTPPAHFVLNSIDHPRIDRPNF